MVPSSTPQARASNPYSAENAITTPMMIRFQTMGASAGMVKWL